jgi:hypothetical protein
MLQSGRALFTYVAFHSGCCTFDAHTFKHHSGCALHIRFKALHSGCTPSTRSVAFNIGSIAAAELLTCMRTLAPASGRPIALHSGCNAYALSNDT